MKALLIGPLFPLSADDERSRACIELVTDMVVKALRSGGDHFHYVVDWLDPGDEPSSGGFNEEIAEPHVSSLGDAATLTDRIRKSVNPFDGTYSTVRSISTYRAVTFGYDGQAFLCLREEDAPPVSSDPSLVSVEERSELLTHSDYFDGWARDEAE